MLPRCASLFVASAVTSELLCSLYPIDRAVIHIIRPPFQFEKSLCDRAATPNSAARRPRAAAPIQLLAVANIIPRKGIGVLIRCLAQLREAGSHAWRLAVVGRTDTDATCFAELRDLVTSLDLEGHVEVRAASSARVGGDTSGRTLGHCSTNRPQTYR